MEFTLLFKKIILNSLEIDYHFWNFPSNNETVLSFLKVLVVPKIRSLMEKNFFYDFKT